MSIPTAAYSVRLRVRLDNVPGTLGRLCIAVGEAGGNIIGLEGFEAKAAHLDEDLIVNCRDAEHMQVVHDAVHGLDGCEVLEFEDRTFAAHRTGKIRVSSTMQLRDMHDLSMAYTPGVARVCSAIAEDADLAFTHTIKHNSVAVVSDGTAVLGLGDIGPRAAMPVMEGKAQLFKEFGGIDAYPVCLDVPTGDVDAIVETVERIAPGFGGINLEDIAAPHCFEVEERLRASLDIPVFHDDQHGTAVVVLAALENALRLVGKRLPDLRVAILGAGASGTAIAKIMIAAGVGDVVGVDRQGVIHAGRDGLSGGKRWFAEHTNRSGVRGGIGDALRGADVFVGVSGPGLVSVDDIAGMGRDPVVFALANPTPEVLPSEVGHLAAVMATGRSDYPNQINNVLCFPGIFRGALDAHASTITEGMKVAAARAIADCVDENELRPAHVIPSALDRRVGSAVGRAVATAAAADGVSRIRSSTGGVTISR
ncbi:NAD-dependent malic enzyme [Aquipuribacter nitratireducens]|uniref:NAD-dependent malic enzyme n=1 Tax=Aquipuribacter nitratireducens TaxID=650104 RepID=A0ABW0GS67_9MICO